jgi:hypothetical protein
VSLVEYWEQDFSLDPDSHTLKHDIAYDRSQEFAGILFPKPVKSRGRLDAVVANRALGQSEVALLGKDRTILRLQCGVLVLDPFEVVEIEVWPAL